MVTRDGRSVVMMEICGATAGSCAQLPSGRMWFRPNDTCRSCEASSRFEPPPGAGRRVEAAEEAGAVASCTQQSPINLTATGRLRSVPTSRPSGLLPMLSFQLSQPYPGVVCEHWPARMVEPDGQRSAAGTQKWAGRPGWMRWVAPPSLACASRRPSLHPGHLQPKGG